MPARRPSSALPRRAAPPAAAFINGTAAHGEDFDDTFEGGPVHAGAVMVPAVLAVAEQEGLRRRRRAARHGGGGRDHLPPEPGGAEGGAQGGLPSDGGVRRDRAPPPASAPRYGWSRRQLVDALGIAGSMASGIIEYLADGSWTKRMHPGWAAQSGLRAALLARAGFTGPRTVFEGVHGLFHGFAHTREGNYARAARWLRRALADRRRWPSSPIRAGR